MATQYANGRIVTDGLVLALDSTDKTSYPGSGTTWYDLSGNRNHATMYNMNLPSAGNTSGFDTTTNYMMFDRHLGGSDATVNNVIIVPNSTTTQGVLCQSGMTIDMWFRETSTVCTAFTKWDSSWELYYCSTMTFRTQGTGGNDGSASIGTSPGTWRNIVATHNGTTRNLTVNNTIVLNDTNVVTNQNTANPIAIGAYASGIYASIGAIPIYRLYNRVLTPAEIASNYNATKSRFNL
jgi:hypothetical protein